MGHFKMAWASHFGWGFFIFGVGGGGLVSGSTMGFQRFIIFHD